MGGYRRVYQYQYSGIPVHTFPPKRHTGHIAKYDTSDTVRFARDTFAPALATCPSCLLHRMPLHARKTPTLCEGGSANLVLHPNEHWVLFDDLEAEFFINCDVSIAYALKISRNTVPVCEAQDHVEEPLAVLLALIRGVYMQHIDVPMLLRAALLVTLGHSLLNLVLPNLGLHKLFIPSPLLLLPEGGGPDPHSRTDGTRHCLLVAWGPD
mmetsp:Transcript_31078/g.78225  ORF Transcript_31078/g.78225 Transcript_31078/m.78225 type:complete len:210 (-) Transcript_31078:418-1047(-)